MIDIFFADSLVGYISAEVGTFSSVDGGKIWEMVSEERARAMFFTEKEFGWGAFVTRGGMGLKNLAYTADGAKTWNAVVITSVDDFPAIDSNQPDFTLYGSYPNPFNAQTKILFQLHRPHTHLKLKIYDVRGQELRVLVNQGLSAGIHHVIWDGKDAEGQPAAAGLYFYELSSEYLKETRKMLLLL